MKQKNNDLQGTLKIPTREEFHRSYTGSFTQADFCTDYPKGGIADRISSAFRFDRQCECDSRLRDK